VKRWSVLAAGTLAVFGALGLGRFGYTALLPAMQGALLLDNTQAGALASVNLAGYLAMSVLGGALASRYGARWVIALGLVVAGAGMLLTGTAEGFGTAALWRGVTGVGSGAANVATMGLWAAWFTARRRGLAAGIAVTGSSLGLIFAGPLVPWLLATGAAAGWRTAWYLFGGVTLAIALIALMVIRSRPEHETVDLATAYGAPAHGRGEGLRWGLVYRSGPVWHLGLVYSTFGFAYIIFVTFFIKRLVAEGGYSRADAGALFMTMGICSLACGALWGAVSDRIGRRLALAAVFAIHAVAYAVFALWPTPAGFTLAAVLFGLAAWSIPAIMAATCGDVLGPRLAPAALGFVTLFFGVGQALAPSVAGAMADRAGSFAPAYLLAAGVALLGALGALTLRPPAPPAGEYPDHAP